MLNSWLTRVTASFAALSLCSGLVFLTGCDDCNEGCKEVKVKEVHCNSCADQWSNVQYDNEPVTLHQDNDWDYDYRGGDDIVFDRNEEAGEVDYRASQDTKMLPDVDDFKAEDRNDSYREHNVNVRDHDDSLEVRSDREFDNRSDRNFDNRGGDININVKQEQAPAPAPAPSAEVKSEVKTDANLNNDAEFKAETTAPKTEAKVETNVEAPKTDAEINTDANLNKDAEVKTETKTESIDVNADKPIDTGADSTKYIHADKVEIKANEVNVQKQ